MTKNRKFIQFYKDHLNKGDQFCMYYEEIRQRLFRVLHDDYEMDITSRLGKHLLDLVEGDSFSDHVNTWVFDYVEQQMIRKKPELYITFLKQVG